jgi:diguanylate cyclase (GGDEF)-like protein
VLCIDNADGDAERERLAALHGFGILDTGPDDDFDTIARLAAGICDAPMAMVSLVDSDRQWFKARVGIELQSTPRDVAFCSQAIMTPGRPTIVSDARADERFANNPLVVGDPSLRFYAGVPLVTRDGHALGTVCVADTIPRTLTPDQLGSLTVAAKAVMTLLEQRRMIEQLERARSSQKGVERELRGEIAVRIAAEERLRHTAAHDGLTQLANRLTFMAEVQAALSELRPAANPAAGFAVLFVDLDRFKHINDSAGHEAGDEVLVEIAQRLRRIVRPEDLVARLGGDEFTVLARGVASAAAAGALARRIAGAFEAPFRIGSDLQHLTASIGAVLGERRHLSAEEVLRDADNAMYESKAQGRDRFSLFDGSPREHTGSKSGVAGSIRRALRERRFRLAYQPIVAFPERRIEGFEALLRWPHPRRGEIAASNFIGIAEESGNIVALGEWALEEACRQLRRWQDRARPGEPPLRMSVNVSAKQLNDRRFAQTVRRVVRERGIQPGTLGLELTESAVMERSENALSVLSEIAALGIEIHLDDFGTGYSSLSYLRRLPVSRLKLDRSFVSDGGDGLADPVIVETVISLAHRTGCKVVAEGVETAAQDRALEELGCDAAQGFWYSRPLPAADAYLDLIVGAS